MVAYLLSKPNGSWKASMKVWVGLPATAAVVVVFLIFAGVAALPAAMAAVVEHTFVVSSMHVCIHTYCTDSEQANYGYKNVCIYAGEPSKSDALVQGDAGHRGERAAPGAGDRGHGGRLGGRPCRQQVAVQHDDPLVMDRSFLFPPNPSPSPSIDPS